MSNRPWRLLLEKLRSPAEIAGLLPAGRAGRPVHPQTIRIWITRGVPLPDGSRLRLEAVRCASKWYTSLEAVARFCELQTPGLQSDAEPGRGASDGRETGSNAGGQEFANGS